MGSSPLTRGKRQAPPPHSRPRRLIPAHAGKTCPETRRYRATWAHPRSRGENSMISLASAPMEGSSPLTRGKPRGHRGCLAPGGLIPAHAGKTLVAYGVTIGAWAHPRSRGENSLMDVQNTFCEGSSPLTRGKPRGRAARAGVAGLIPAHAGKTPRRPDQTREGTAHPRSRGENAALRPRRRSGAGSSPLTRGKHHGERRGRRRWGLIPAHAGKTSCRTSRSSGEQAHPRSRGENVTVSEGWERVAGSSPLARGKLFNRPNTGRLLGLIPARAGKT